ncbi:unnamed protein product, partial [Meganyctiphanes norvegica]
SNCLYRELTALSKRSAIVLYYDAGKLQIVFSVPRDSIGSGCVFLGRADPGGNAIILLGISYSLPRNIAVPYDFSEQGVSNMYIVIWPIAYCLRVNRYRRSINYWRLFPITVSALDTDSNRREIICDEQKTYHTRLMSPDSQRLIKILYQTYVWAAPAKFVMKHFFFQIYYQKTRAGKFFKPNQILEFHLTHAFTQKGYSGMLIRSLRKAYRSLTATSFAKSYRSSQDMETWQSTQTKWVRKFHGKRLHDKIQIQVSRDKLLETSMKATKNFNVADWCKNFEFTFQGEEGLDWGGLRREWFELICSQLFDNDNGLFTSLHDGRQALVHPDPNRPSHLKLKHYEFAGRVVGKCLYESSLGSGYRLTVRARFSRSFLAQLIGLRVHYKHFAQDDPELYNGKIRHILDNAVEDIGVDLTFADEICIPGGQIKTVELEPGGAAREVTDNNKMAYIDALTQYRLATRVRHEVDSFLVGLNDIIPDNLLCIFDENELELLMCGIEEYSIADFKANHVVNGSSAEFRRVLYWFWTAVSNFTEEEMARLLQFTTGCSRLPPGGFAQLTPHFQISAAHTFGVLPTAHTCFNQLCLPDYDTYEQFEKAILLAIKEGSEGFGMV